MQKYDVAVIGGGFAGVAAAIAAKTGKKLCDIDANDIRKELDI